jgi:hypothetical protein
VGLRAAIDYELTWKRKGSKVVNGNNIEPTRAEAAQIAAIYFVRIYHRDLSAIAIRDVENLLEIF